VESGEALEKALGNETDLDVARFRTCDEAAAEKATLELKALQLPLQRDNSTPFWSDATGSKRAFTSALETISRRFTANSKSRSRFRFELFAARRTSRLAPVRLPVRPTPFFVTSAIRSFTSGVAGAPSRLRQAANACRE
jgi:hypothetical protein